MPTPEFIARLRAKIGNDPLLVPTVVIIARDSDKRVLVVHDRDSGEWTLPGGIVEPDEVPADAAVREVWEETGVLVELARLVAVIGGPGCSGTYANGDQLCWVATLFSAVITSGALMADGQEISDARLVNEAELAAMPLRPQSRRFLDAEQQAAGGVFFERPSWKP